LRALAFFLNGCEYGRYVGGAERRFLEISPHLQKLGVEIFALEYEPSLSETWGYGCDSIKTDRRFANHAILETARMILKGVKACIRNRCDIIYVPIRHCFGHNNIVNIIPAYIISLTLRKPLAIVFDLLLPTDLSERNIIRRVAYKHAKACIAVSQSIANDFKKVFGLPNFFTSSNGVDLTKFRSVKPQTKTYDAVFLGRIAEEKGISTLLEAWKALTTQMPSAQLLLLGGIESTHMKESWVKTIEKLGLSRNVTLPGFVPDEEVVRLLKSSRVFVFPSTAEGFGLAIVEAMAAGLPCILSDLPCLKENFHSAAIFVPPRDPEALTQAILDLLSDPEKRKKLTENGQTLVERFSWEAVAEREFKILSSISRPQSHIEHNFSARKCSSCPSATPA
jgi:glycosyltransferase involved in cell wall biosynthesis